MSDSTSEQNSKKASHWLHLQIVFSVIEFFYVIGLIIVVSEFYPMLQRYTFFWPVPILIAAYVSLFMLWKRLIETLEHSQGRFEGRKKWQRI